jgi:DNA-binding CsgD family transcriptional regulator
MNDILFIAIIFLSICAGLYAILVTYQLNKKYRLSYLSTFLYFQIFFNVFGLYGILGQVIAKRVLLQQESSLKTIETIGHFFSFLGMPFLILAFYMFIRLCWEVIEKKLSRTFNLSYFFSLLFIFIAYGVVIVLLNLLNFRDEQYAFFSSAIIFLYIFVEVLVLFIALPQLLINANKIKDEDKQKAVQIFAYLYLFVFCASLIVLLLAARNWTLSAVYLLVFLSGNIPPVLYWRTYLSKHFVAPVLQTTGTLAMKQFLAEYKISKREEEVIQLLCDGKTNKEISETLFISLQTVKDHIYRIFQKTDVKNRVQLINLIQSYKSEGE